MNAPTNHTGPKSNVIAPCLWFDDQGEEAARFYTSIVPSSRIVAITNYPTTYDNPSDKPRGSTMTVEFELDGQRFTALNGGPYFKINPTVSFFLYAPDEAATDRLATALAEGGTYLMELGEYPWSPRYAWVQDRFGVSWQVMMARPEQQGSSITPCLMFAGRVHGRAEEALRHYADVFGGNVAALERYGPDQGAPEGTLMHGRASLGAQDLVAMDSHLEHEAEFNEAASLEIHCRDQGEVDYFWDRLTDGGEEGPCGWLKDRFGVSWQVVPTQFVEMLRTRGAGPGYERAFQVMLEMKKLDVAELMEAFEPV